MKHKKVIERFANSEPNKCQGNKCCWSAGSIFCEPNKLFSFGKHFTLAVRLPQGSKAPFLLNGEYSSHSTTKHQNLAVCTLLGPTVSFSALRAAGIHEADFLNGSATIKDYVHDRHFIAREHKTKNIFQRAANYEGYTIFPTKLQFVPCKKQGSGYRTFYQPEGDWIYYSWHLGGVGVLIAKNGKNFLGILDERQYCCIELRRPAASVAAAIEQLKPHAVKQAEAAGVTVQRQGEWFFVKQRIELAEFADNPMPGELCKHLRRQGFNAVVADIHSQSLPSLPRQSNYHNVTKMLIVGKGKKQQIWCSGKVFHRDAITGNLTKEHATLQLTAWYRAYRNVEATSWTTTGKFD